MRDARLYTDLEMGISGSTTDFELVEGISTPANIYGYMLILYDT